MRLEDLDLFPKKEESEWSHREKRGKCEGETNMLEMKGCNCIQ